jgi:hypothetical protein
MLLGEMPVDGVLSDLLPRVAIFPAAYAGDGRTVFSVWIEAHDAKSGVDGFLETAAAHDPSPLKRAARCAIHILGTVGPPGLYCWWPITRNSVMPSADS